MYDAMEPKQGEEEEPDPTIVAVASHSIVESNRAVVGATMKRRIRTRNRSRAQMRTRSRLGSRVKRRCIRV